MAEPCFVSHDGGKTWVAFVPQTKLPRTHLVRNPRTGKYTVKQGLK